MNTQNKSPKSKTPPGKLTTSVLRNLFYGLAILVLLFVSIKIAAIGLGFYDLDLRIPFVLLSVLLVIALNAAILNKMQTFPKRWFVNVITVVTLFGASFLVIGFVQDLLGIHCRGFDWAYTSCAETWSVTPFLLLLNPIAISVTLVIAGVPWLFEVISNQKKIK